MARVDASTSASRSDCLRTLFKAHVLVTRPFKDLLDHLRSTRGSFLPSLNQFGFLSHQFQQKRRRMEYRSNPGLRSVHADFVEKAVLDILNPRHRDSLSIEIKGSFEDRRALTSFLLRHSDSRVKHRETSMPLRWSLIRRTRNSSQSFEAASGINAVKLGPAQAS